MNCLTLFAIVVVSVASAVEVTEPNPALYKQWNLFKNEFHKTYKSDKDEDMRRLLWEERYKQIEELNQKFKKGEISYQVGENQFMDWTPEEMKNLYGLKLPNEATPTPEPAVPARRKRAVASSVDWRDSNAVTSVKDQGGCGSCYAFASIAAIESRRFIKDGTLLELSEQEIVDCTTSYGNLACGGGSPVYVYRYAIEKSRNGSSLTKGSCYSYTSGTTIKAGTCTSYSSDCLSSSTISSLGYITGEANMKDKIANNGPIVGMAYASLASFNFYKSGVYDDTSCANKTVDHAMAIVGYGTTDDGADYWLLKNSWGSWWGESGYVKIARGKNRCSIESGAYYPTI